MLRLTIGWTLLLIPIAAFIGLVAVVIDAMPFVGVMLGIICLAVGVGYLGAYLIDTAKSTG